MYVGKCVGDRVGDAVGAGVGTAVGACVGAGVGADVGKGVTKSSIGALVPTIVSARRLTCRAVSRPPVPSKHIAEVLAVHVVVLQAIYTTQHAISPIDQKK